MLPIFGTSVDILNIGMVDDGFPKVVCPYKSDSDFRILMAEEFESGTCKLLKWFMLLTRKSGEETNNTSFFLPPKMECFWDGNVLNTFSTTLPAMIERWLSENANQ